MGAAAHLRSGNLLVGARGVALIVEPLRPLTHQLVGDIGRCCLTVLLGGSDVVGRERAGAVGQPRTAVADLDRANRRARTIRKGGKADDLLYDIRTARMLGQLQGPRRVGPVFLSTRRAPEGSARAGELDPASRRLRMTYRTAERHLGAATTSRVAPAGWDLHDLLHSRLTHAGEDGATEADLMNLSGHEDRRTLQRYLKPSKEGTHRRLDEIDAHRDTWTPSAEELAARMATR